MSAVLIPSAIDPWATQPYREHLLDWLLSQGRTPLRLPFGEKAPKILDWSKWTHAEVLANRATYFPKNEVWNLGLIQGEASGRLFCVDHDWNESIPFGDLLLLLTMAEGRPSRRRAHRYYTGELKSKQWKDPLTHEVIVEIRGEGSQMMCAGSIHPNGELVDFEPGTLPPVAADPAKLIEGLNAVVAFSLLARYWPETGRRLSHLALANVLLKAGWSVELVTEILCLLPTRRGEDEARRDRERAVRGTQAKIEAEDPVVGWGELFKHVNRRVVIEVRRLLGGGKKPEIVVGTDVEKTCELTIEAVAHAGLEDPAKRVFKRGGVLVRMVRAEKPPEENEITRRAMGSPSIEEIPKTTFWKLAASSAEWWRVVEKDGLKTQRKALPPTWVGDVVFDEKRWPAIDHLVMFAQAPLLLENGTVLQRPGYDERSGILYEPNADYPLVPENPTREDVSTALAALWDPVFQFPFQANTDFSALVAACLTPLAQLAYNTCSPMFLFDAPAQGSGKSYLAKICGIISTGDMPPCTSFTSDSEELRKRITTHAIKGDRLVIFDNVGDGQVLGGDALAAVLTSPKWSDRMLGSNRDWTGTLTTTFYATANNCTVSTDMARRLLSCTIDPKREHPELRENWKHEDVLGYVEKNRPRLVTAALTLLRAYFAAGCPKVPYEPWGSYEGWARVVLGTIVFCGLPDPSPKRVEVSVGDLKTEYDRSFVIALRDFVAKKCNGHGATASKIVEAAFGEPIMREALEALTKSRQPSAVQVSGVLRRLRNKVFSGLYVVDLGEDPSKKVRYWAVKEQGAR